jgi:two-component system NarL family sensor kinase
MSAPPSADWSPSGTLLIGEHHVLELLATGAPLGEALDALCRVIDDRSGLISSVYLLDRDGAHLSLAAGPHVPEAVRQATGSFQATPTAGACGAAVHRREQVIVTDVLASPLCEGWHEAARASGIGAVWSTPFFSEGGRVLGTFAVYGHESRRPDEAQLRLVDRATHLASIAVERHQTEQELRESERRLARSESLVRLVLDALPVGVAVVDGAGDIILSNPASRRIWGDSIRSGPERYARSRAWWHHTGKEVRPDEWASVRALLNGETSVNEVIDIQAFDGVRKVIQNSAVPIRDASDRITGAVIVNEDISARTTAERERNEAFEQMRTLTGRLLRAQDDERRRIAQMLHETTAQDLAALKMHLARLSRADLGLSGGDRAALTESIGLAERSMSGIRTLSYVLHPPLLDEAGLVSALRWYAAGFAQRSGVRVELDLPSTFERLPQVVEMTLFRVVQEALINIHHHAESPTASIRLRVDGQCLTLEIADRGGGMPPEVIAHLPTGGGALGVGVTGMRERLQQLGGTLEIDSSARGTTVRARIPLPARAP